MLAKVLSNAVKFTERGMITVRARLTEGDTAKQTELRDDKTAATSAREQLDAKVGAFVGRGKSRGSKGSGNKVAPEAKRDVDPVQEAAIMRRGRPWTLKVDVIDTGIGIKPEDIARLFKPFSQVDSAINRKFVGAGMGLVICRHLCRLMVSSK